MTDSLFVPLTLRGRRLPNRPMVSPMCQCSAPAGVATDWHLVHLGSRAVGGAGLVVTEALTRDGIESVVESFVAGAGRARAAGFEVAEIHAAHGYLLHEFCSPVTNDRDDEYGGDFAGRTRLVREVTAAVRAAWPDDEPVFVRLWATDWLPDRESWTVDDTVRPASELHEAGADLIDVSAGGVHPDQQVPDAGAGYQVPYAERVREAGVPVGTVGGIAAAEHADAQIRNGRADLTVLGREHLRDPYFGLHAAADLDADVDRPVQYRRARR